jgi:ATP-dependent RNA helicase DeaD
VSQVEQRFFSVEPWDKNRLLVHLLKHEEPGVTLVFCRTKATVDRLTDYITRKGVAASAIHGDLHQGKRNQVMTKLRSGELSVLVASDLAARGLDVDDISHVINFDLPEDPEVYVHRIGRTARAGRKGIAWSFVSPGQGDLLTNVEKLTNVEITEAEYDDFKPGSIPDRVVKARQQDEARIEAVRKSSDRTSGKLPSASEGNDDAKFPDGLVPKAMPGKRMGGRLRTRRR